MGRRTSTDHDAFLAPIMPVAAFPHDNRDGPSPERTLEFDGHTIRRPSTSSAWAGAFGAVLLPAVVIPAGLTPGGLPVGRPDRRARTSKIAGSCRIAAARSIAVGPGFQRPPGY